MSAVTTVVVGRGLFGTATAKYLQRIRGERVLAVGPTKFDSNYGVYSSHNDQGRVVRLIGFDDYWTDLNVEAAFGFRQLELETGMTVVHRTGCVTACEIPYERSAYFQEDRVQRTASRVGLNIKVTTSQTPSEALLQETGFLGFGAPHVENAAFEDGTGGAG